MMESSRSPPPRRLRRSPLTFLLLSALLLLLSSPIAVSADGDEGTTVRVEFDVQLSQDTAGKFTVEVHPSWAPLGSARFLELVDTGDSFWKGIRFFRVIEGFMAQFGIPGDPQVAAEWREKKLKDDEVKESNKRGYLSFATSGKDSRTTQMFINLVDNTNLDGQDFSPFARVVEGMDVVDSIYSGYGEGAPFGEGPMQSLIQSEGNEYLERDFPMLSYVKSVTRLDGGDVGGGDEEKGEGLTGAETYSGGSAVAGKGTKKAAAAILAVVGAWIAAGII